MRRLISIAMAFSFAFVAATLLAEDKPAPKEPLTFESKMGNVTFDHAKHVERAKNDCKACHPEPFKQEKAPLNYAANMHKTAETQKTSCAKCHVAGGASFETKGNCNKCHVKKAAG